MRRLFVLPLVASVVLGLAGPASAAPTSDAASVAAPQPLTAAARGLVLSGLRPGSAGERCRNKYVLVVSGACTHGPDAAPPGVDVRVRRPLLAADNSSGGSTTAAASSTVPCYGDGSSGLRVQAVYVHASDVADRYGQVLSSIRQWAADADSVFNTSAAETGGVRHVRYVTDSSCNLSVPDVTLSPTGDDSMDNTINELRNQGYNRTDRKYLVWMDANVYCGIAQVYDDDSSGQSNLSNGNSQVAGEVARVDNGCWGAAGQLVEAHELMHTLGGVQTSAPHATPYNHCYDESDRMCYSDGSGVAMQQVCPTSHENVFDCNHDDYFYAGTPGSGNYLATHWNTANSAFLATSDPAPPTTQPPPPPPPPPPSGSSAGGFVVDNYGGVHGYGSAADVSTPAAWPGWDIARGVAARPDGRSGYMLDGWGGIHPFGGAPAVRLSAYWQGWDIARGVALNPADTSGNSGYVLDGWGGVHPFGGAPAVSVTAYWPGWDIAAGIVVNPPAEGHSGVSGYVLDGWGGVHPFWQEGTATIGAPSITAYWPGWKIVHGLVATGYGRGYVLDGWGGVHPFGGAQAVTLSAYWQGWDIARGVAAAGASGGEVVDGWGGVHPFWTSGAASQSPPQVSGYWPGADRARGID